MNEEFSQRTNKLFNFVFGRNARPIRERVANNNLKEIQFQESQKYDSVLSDTGVVAQVFVSKYKVPKIPTFLCIKSEKNDVSIMKTI
jgi:hypothetical protein